jgi:hypothetical protein
MDAGEFVQLEYDEEEGWDVKMLRDFHIDDPESVFLIDHSVTYFSNAHMSLLVRQHPGLHSRLMNLLDLEEEEEEEEAEKSDENGDQKKRYDNKVNDLGSSFDPAVHSNREGVIFAECISVHASSIQAAGQGAFAKRHIPAGTLLGIYQGDSLTEADAKAKYPKGDAFYLLSLPDSDALIDAADPDRSNWLRYLNHAPSK